MTVRNKFVAGLFSAAASLVLTNCGAVKKVEEDTAEVLTTYDIGIKNGVVVEFRSASNPDLVMIGVDGVEASGIAILGQSDGNLTDHKVLAKYKTEAGKVFEFTPAAASDQTCFFLDGAFSGDLICHRSSQKNPSP